MKILDRIMAHWNWQQNWILENVVNFQFIFTKDFLKLFNINVQFCTNCPMHHVSGDMLNIVLILPSSLSKEICFYNCNNCAVSNDICSTLYELSHALCLRRYVQYCANRPMHQVSEDKINIVLILPCTLSQEIIMFNIILILPYTLSHVFSSSYQL